MKKLRFCDIRIQVEQVLSEKLLHDANSFRLAIWFAIHRFDKKTGICAVTDATLAEEFELSTDTIARTVRKLSTSGLFRIKRGRTGRATEYALSDDVWAHAIARKQGARMQGAKVDGGGKVAEPSTAILRGQTQRECGPSLEKDKRKKHPSGSDRTGWLALGGLDYHPVNSFYGKQFKETLESLGYNIELTDLPFEEGENGRLYLMPNHGLPRTDTDMRIKYQKLLRVTLLQLDLLDRPKG